jgi:hypothetical protein
MQPCVTVMHGTCDTDGASPIVGSDGAFFWWQIIVSRQRKAYDARDKVQTGRLRRKT